MRKLCGFAIGIVLLAGCGQLEQDPTQLETARVDYCNFAGGPRVVPYGTVVASGSADCRFVRDGRDSAQANSYLQKRRPDGTWQTLTASLAKKWTLPARVNVAWHLFDDLHTVGICETGVFRTKVVVKWPLNVSNPIQEVWYSVNRQLSCTR